MPYALSWRLVFHARTAEKGRRRLEDVRQLLGGDLEVTLSGWFPETPHRWELCLESPPFEASAAEATLRALQLADALGSGWVVTGPTLADGRLSTLEGVFDAERDGRASRLSLAWGWFVLRAV